MVQKTGFDNFDGALPPDWMNLFRQPDITHTAFAQSFEQAIGPDDATGNSVRSVRSGRVPRRRSWGVVQRHPDWRLMSSARTAM